MYPVQHLERLRTMLRQTISVAPGESTLTVLESLELPEHVLDFTTDAVQRLDEDQPVSHDLIRHEQETILEALVHSTYRPTMFIVDDTFRTPPSPWEHLGDPKIKTRIEKAIPSVGRVEISGHPLIQYGGTGFVVGPNLVMTNRHIAETFASGVGLKQLKFISGRKSTIDFKAEVFPDTDNLELIEVTRIAMIHPYWDMALLEVRGLSKNHPMLTLSVEPPEALLDRDVVIIGYPALDWRNNAELQNRIFKGVFNIKRIQPGKIRTITQIESFDNFVEALTHDASTLALNSGSAVVDTSSGEVVGLNFAGSYLDANFAVPSHHLATDNQVVQAGVRFSGNVAPTSFWGPVWEIADAPSAPSNSLMSSIPFDHNAEAMSATSTGPQSSVIDATLTAPDHSQSESSLSVQIDRMYDQIDLIRVQLVQTPDCKSLRQELKQSVAALRDLQEQEATYIYQRFEERLKSPLGAGAKLIDKADELIKHYANPST